MAILLDVPTCTHFELVEPPLPVAPVRCAEEAVGLALADSPEIREAEQNIAKACAAVAAGKLDYVPSIAVVGGYANQTGMDYVQPNIGFVGVMGTYTFVDWGKRRNTIHEREQMVAMATLKVEQTKDDVRQKALKAFREYEQSQQALKLAADMVAVRKDGEKAATVPTAKFTAGQGLDDGPGGLHESGPGSAHRFCEVDERHRQVVVRGSHFDQLRPTLLPFSLCPPTRVESANLGGQGCRRKLLALSLLRHRGGHSCPIAAEPQPK